jgi:hypothetical protein
MNTLEAIAYLLESTPYSVLLASDYKLDAISHVMLPINRHKRWIREELDNLLNAALV